MVSKFGIVTLVILLSCVFVSPVRSQVTNHQKVTIYVRSCSASDVQPVTLTVVDIDGKVVVSKRVTRQPAVAIQLVEFEASPGSYTVGVSSGQCAAGVTVSVLPNRDRYIVLLTNKLTFLNANVGALFGFLPSRGWHVAIVFKDRRARQGQLSSPDGYLEVPADVDGDAYYAIHLPNGSATVRLYGQAQRDWIDFSGGTIASGSTWLRRDITTEELNKM